MPFKNFKNNPIVLREEVLDEVPIQVREFYKMKQIRPKPMRVLDPIKLDVKRGNTFENNKNFLDLY